MKKFFTLLVLAACCAAMTWGCSDDKYDDTEIRQEIENLKQEIASMKEQVNSLKTIIHLEHIDRPGRRVPLPLPAERRGRNQRRTHGLQKQVGRNARFLRPDRCRGDPHRQPLVGNGFLDLHAGPSPTLRTDLERDRLQL